MLKKYRKSGINFVKITNNSSMKVILCDLGASIYLIENGGEIMTPQVKKVKDFWPESVRFGKNVGRVAGRIPNHTLTIDGNSYDLSANERTNTLHGGHDGIATKKFLYLTEEKDDCYKIDYYLLSKDGESGFPGEATIKITYKVYKEISKIDINYEVVCDKDCPFSITTHTFFNLGDENLKDSSLYVNASKYVRASYETLVQEETLDVPSCLDFRKVRKIIDTIDDPLMNQGVIQGYDHYLLFDDENISKPQIILENSRHILKIFTDYNSSVIYSDNNIDSLKLNNSSRNNRRGLAIEPQISCMDNLILKRGEKYSHFVNYLFEIKGK